MNPSRRQFALTGGAALATAAVFAGASRALATGSSQTIVVDRWLDEVVRTGATDRIEEFVRPDIVVVLHGIGASQDGTPRRIEGVAAVREWITQVRSRWVSTPEIRVDDRIIDGGKVAVRGRAVWYRQTTEGRVKTHQSIAGFYYVENGRLYQIERYAAPIRSAAS